MHVFQRLISSGETEKKNSRCSQHAVEHFFFTQYSQPDLRFSLASPQSHMAQEKKITKDQHRAMPNPATHHQLPACAPTFALSVPLLNR